MTGYVIPGRDDARHTVSAGAGSSTPGMACGPDARKGSSGIGHAWLALGVLAAALASVQPARADDWDLRRGIIGSWGRDAECTDQRLSFRPDGVMADELPSPAQGHYTIENGTISLIGGWRGSVRAKDETLRVSISGDELTFRPLNGEDGDRSVKLVRCGPGAGPAR